MAMENFKNITSITQNIIKQYVHLDSIVLDCTVGNGNDTKLLAEQVGTSGFVYGFDIQDIAIYNTMELLKLNKLDNRVRLFKDSHEHIDRYIKDKLDFVIYNLGYLPGGDKSIITESRVTIISINKSLQLLKRGGLLIVAAYIGHPGGMDEKNTIENLFSNLQQKEFNVVRNKFINQKNNPPLLYIVEKK